MSNLLASFGHAGKRRVILGHPLNIQTPTKTDAHKKFWGKFTILFWANFIAILGCKRVGHPCHVDIFSTAQSNILWGILNQFIGYFRVVSLESKPTRTMNDVLLLGDLILNECTCFTIPLVNALRKGSAFGSDLSVIFLCLRDHVCVHAHKNTQLNTLFPWRERHPCSHGHGTRHLPRGAHVMYALTPQSCQHKQPCSAWKNGALTCTGSGGSWTTCCMRSLWWCLDSSS